jgi:ferredoxin
MIGDCASDAPLSGTLRAIACARAEDVLLGLGALGGLKIAVRHDDAELALREAARRLGAVKLEIVRLPDAWPPSVDGPDARVLVAASPRRKDSARYVTVAGAVGEPSVLPVRGWARVEELVARAGGPLDDDWLPVIDHQLVDRDAEWMGAPLILILPARHPLVRKLKTPVSDWLLRAASACEGCRVCSDSCAHLSPHEVVWTLATLRDDGIALAAAAACTGCGLCDAMCPSALSPRALVVDVRERMRGANVKFPDKKIVAGLDVKLLTQRMGLADYDRELLRKFS